MGGKSGFPDGTVVKNPPSSAGDTGETSSIPWPERSPGEGNGNPLQYSCFKHSMNRGVWWATVYRIAKLDTTEHAHTQEKKKLKHTHTQTCAS